jgi:hypothetical protein
MPLHRLTTTWRDWYNPLKGLSMSRIVAMEDAAERGQHADLQWLWNAMERTDVTVQAAIARRLSFMDSIECGDPRQRERRPSALIDSNSPLRPQVLDEPTSLARRPSHPGR